MIPTAPRVAQLGTAGEEHIKLNESRRGEVRAAMPGAVPRSLPGRARVLVALALTLVRVGVA